MATTSKSTRAGTRAGTKSGAATAKLQKENSALNERYAHLQQRIGGLRYHIATNENITTEEVIRLIDNVIDAS